MNQFYNAVKVIKDRLSSNVLVNTVIFARTEEKDLYKKKIYPLVHINPIEIPFSNSQDRQYTFEIGVFEQRDINNEETTTTFEGNDDVIDNLNVADIILNDLTSYLTNQNNDFDIELVSASSAFPLLIQDSNLLDGWVQRITVSAPNTIISSC